MRSLAIALVTLTTSHAWADAPGEVARIEPGDEKNPLIGLGISLGAMVGATVASIAIIEADGGRASTLQRAGIGTLVAVAPSAGRWYSGELGLAGIAVRGVSALLLVHNVNEQDSLNRECDFVTPQVCDEIEAKYDRADRNIKIAIGVMVAATVYDFVQSGLAAERWNRNHGIHVGPMMFASHGRRTPGFVVTASF